MFGVLNAKILAFSTLDANSLIHTYTFYQIWELPTRFFVSSKCIKPNYMIYLSIIGYIYLNKTCLLNKLCESCHVNLYNWILLNQYDMKMNCHPQFYFIFIFLKIITNPANSTILSPLYPNSPRTQALCTWRGGTNLVTQISTLNFWDSFLNLSFCTPQ